MDKRKRSLKNYLKKNYKLLNSLKKSRWKNYKKVNKYHNNLRQIMKEWTPD